MSHVNDYKDRIKELEDNNNDDLHDQLQEKDAIISNLNARISVLEKEAIDESEIAELQNIIQTKEKTISSLKQTNSDLKLQFEEQNSIVNDLKQLNDNLGKENDALKNKAEDLIEALELKDLQNEVQQLKEELKDTEPQINYWKTTYENLIESSDELAATNETLIKDNDYPKDTNNRINETNKLINENLMGINDNYKDPYFSKNFLNSSRVLSRVLNPYSSFFISSNLSFDQKEAPRLDPNGPPLTGIIPWIM